MRFEFATAGKIVFGSGMVNDAANAAAEMGRCVFVATGGQATHSDQLIDRLGQHGVEVIPHRVCGEPTMATVLEAVTRARENGCNAVAAIGGGSVIDTGKVVAALLTNEGNLMDYLEIVGRGRPLARPSAPCVAIPTTAGSGAEVTRNAVIALPEHRVKVSMRSAWMLPDLAVVDPDLTRTMPPNVTASTGCDALVQLLESFVSLSANPLTDGICRNGLARAGRSLRQACTDGSDRQAREDMALAALFGGLALANSKLGAIHGFAGVLGGMSGAAHGTLCACLAPAALQANVRALNERDSASPALERLDEAAHILTGRADARAAVEWIRGLWRDLAVPSLSQMGVSKADLPSIVAMAREASSMKGNPIVLTDEELTRILESSL